jgi:hypothetical protein
MANSMKRPTDGSTRYVWLVSAAIALLGLGRLGVPLVPVRYGAAIFSLGIIALLVMILRQMSPKSPEVIREVLPQLFGEIQSEVIRPSSTRYLANEPVVETEILLKVSVSNLSPIPANVVQWRLSVEVAGKKCHVQGPLYLAENAFGPPEPNWRRLESVRERREWRDELASWCNVVRGKPVVGWLAFYVQGASAVDLENASITLQIMDSSGRLYHAKPESTRLAA